MRNKYQAGIIAGLLGGLSISLIPLAIVSAAVVAIYIMRKGDFEGMIVLATALIVTGIMSIFMQARPGLSIPVVFFLFIPVFFSAKALRKTQLQGHAVLYAAICGVILAASIQFISGNAVEWWSEWLKIAISGVKGATYQGFEDDGTLQLINGFVAMALVMGTVLSVLLARWMQSVLYNPGGFVEEFCVLRIPASALPASVLITAAAYLISVNLMYDMLIIIAITYFFQGLAIIHHIVENKGYSRTYLIPPYLLFFFFPQYVITGLALSGMLDIFINVRKLPKTL
ncbi:MAG: hypothetical protein ACU833_02320 [Gammaproteobacteria bacterium]